MASGAVLHITTLRGGGVDRHIRDIARTSPRRHLVWHVSARADLIEVPSASFYPLSHGAGESAPLADWLKSQGVGIVHVHSMSAESRQRARWIAAALGLDTIATLHDVLFLRPDGFEPGARREPDAAWLAANAEFLATTRATLVPSDYLAGVARRHLPGIHVSVVPNGSAPPARVTMPRAHAAFEAKGLKNVAVVLGAIGPHKGSRVLQDAARRLEGSDIAIVILGYLDAQLDPGWRSPHLYIHGACNDGDVPGLVCAYGARLALFPNQVPESFSYALSDLWQAGLPALVPPEGALGERVRAHGGGWVLPQAFTDAQLALLLKDLLSPERAAELARVKSVVREREGSLVPPLDIMTRSLDALYARFGIDPSGPIDPLSTPAQALLAANLDNTLFREELARVADEVAQLKAGLEAERATAAQFAAEARAWIAKVEGDLAQVQRELTREVAERHRLDEENSRLHFALNRLPAFIRDRIYRKAHAAG